jgi:site-specific DNA-cytosine methylase
MTIGSLFSGIGGLELGLELAGLGPVRWQIERDAYRRRVLARHWPRAERFANVETVDVRRLERVQLICGGFPCQDISSAGTRAGLAGSRSGLWAHFARIVSECRPEWVVVENVASNANAWVDAVMGDLEQRGYETLPVPISASAVGAWHRRSRVFIVARRPHAHGHWECPLAGHGEVAGGVDSPVADASEERRASARATGEQRGRTEAGARPLADADGIALRLDEQRLAARRPGAVRDEGHALARFPTWAGGDFAAPDLRRVVHGLPSRVDPIRSARIAAIGDSVVPQCAEVVGALIQEILRS